MACLDDLIAANYRSKEITADCRQAVLEYLSSFRTGESRSLHFIKGLTKVAVEMFEQDQHFPSSVLPALISLHEEGIVLAGRLLGIYASQPATNNDSSILPQWKNQVYVQKVHLHLRGHLASLLGIMGHRNLYSSGELMEEGLQRSYELAYTAARQSWESAPVFAVSCLYQAGHAAFDLYLSKLDLSHADKAYHCIAGARAITLNAEMNETIVQKILQTKCFFAYRVFRQTRGDRGAPLNLLRPWIGRAYNSTEEWLQKGKLETFGRANHLYDLAVISLLDNAVNHLPQAGRRAHRHYQEFLDYVAQNSLEEQLPALVRKARINLMQCRDKFS